MPARWFIGYFTAGAGGASGIRARLPPGRSKEFPRRGHRDGIWMWELGLKETGLLWHREGTIYGVRKRKLDGADTEPLFSVRSRH